MHSTSPLCGTFAFLLLLTIPASLVQAAEPAVNWGGDYVSSTLTYARTNGGSNIDYQLDGVLDRRQDYAFSGTAPMNPSNNYAITATNSGRFYGGVQYWRLSSTSSFSASSGHGVINASSSTGGDTLGIHQANQSNRRQFAVFLWDKADFLTASLAGASSVRLDATCSLDLNVRLNMNNHHRYRFLVRNGTQYYLSNFSSLATGSLSGADLMAALWAPYDPVSDMRPVPGLDVGASSLTYSITTESLTNITGLGVYIESVNAVSVSDRSFRIESFGASAVTAAQPPSIPAPQLTSATATGSSTIQIAWTSAATGIDGHRIERSVSAGSGFSEVAVVGSGTTSYVDSGLSASTTYYYRVRSYAGSNQSAYSNVESATTNAPPPPTGIPAPQLFYATAVSRNIIILRWFSTAEDVTGFKIERSLSPGGGFSQIGTTGADGSSYTNSGLQPGTTYYYRIRANSGSTNGDYSVVVSETTPLAADEVIVDDKDSGVTFTGSNWNGGYQNNDLSWANGYRFDNSSTYGALATYPVAIANSGTYEVYGWWPKTSTGSSTNATNAPVTISHNGGTANLLVNQRIVNAQWVLLGVYSFNAGSYTVTVSDAGTTSAVMADAFRFLRAPTSAPAAPARLNAVGYGPGRIIISWTDLSNNEGSFSVERSPNGTSGWTVIGSALANANFYIDSGLTQSTTYFYRVRAVNSVGASAYTNTASATTAAALTRRLWINQSQINALKTAITVNNSHHQQAYNAMKARVDQSLSLLPNAVNWQVYDENTTDGNYNYARSYLAREASLMYLLTDNVNYAQVAYKACELIYTSPDPDNRLPDGGYNNGSNYDLSRATVGFGFAVAYDWAYNGLTQAQRDFLRSKIVSALNDWPNVSVPNNTAPRISNHVAVARSGELLLMLAVNEEASRADRYILLRNHLKEHMGNYSNSMGGFQEGSGYADYAGCFMVPAVLALRSIGDTSLDSTFNQKAFWKLPMYAYSFVQNPATRQYIVLQSGVDGYAPLNQEGWLSSMFGIVPAADLPAYRWFYDRLMGISSPYAAADKFDYRRGSTTWAIIYYPQSGSSSNPVNTMPLAIGDPTRGFYYFRNRWQDENDIMISSMADHNGGSKAWDSAEAFQINLWAYNQKWFGGPGTNSTHAFMSGLFVDGLAYVAKTDTGTSLFHSTSPDGSGYLIAGGGNKYSKLGLSSAARHTLVDFSGRMGPGVLATLDKLTSTTTRSYRWNLALGDNTDNKGITVSSGSEGGRPTFTMISQNGGFVKGWVLAPAGAVLTVPSGINDPLTIDVSATDTQIWVVMVIGTGTAPSGSVSGSGLSTMLTVGNGRVRYDATTDRIISEPKP